jgi:hypothetical protein
MFKQHKLVDVIAVAQLLIIDDNPVLSIQRQVEKDELWLHVEGPVTYSVPNASQLITLENPTITVNACVQTVSEMQPTSLSFYMLRDMTDTDMVGR